MDPSVRVTCSMLVEVVLVNQYGDEVQEHNRDNEGGQEVIEARAVHQIASPPVETGSGNGIPSP